MDGPPRLRRSPLGWVILAAGILFATMGALGAAAMAWQGEPIVAVPLGLLLIGLAIVHRHAGPPLAIRGELLWVRALRPRSIPLPDVALVHHGRMDFGWPPLPGCWAVVWAAGRPHPVVVTSLGWRVAGFSALGTWLESRAESNRQSGVLATTASARAPLRGVALMMAAGVLATIAGGGALVGWLAGRDLAGIVPLVVAGPALAGLGWWLKGKGARIEGGNVVARGVPPIPLEGIADVRTDAGGQAVMVVLRDGGSVRLSMRGLPAGTACAFVNALRQRAPAARR